MTRLENLDPGSLLERDSEYFILTDMFSSKDVHSRILVNLRTGEGVFVEDSKPVNQIDHVDL